MERWVELAANIMEGAGVLATIVGAASAAVLAAIAWRHDGRPAAYRTARQSLGRAVLPGLELLVGADIIRTVSHTPTLTQVGVLGLIVVVQTFLSFTLDVELEGRWPWRRAGTATDQIPGDPLERAAAAGERLGGRGRAEHADA